MAGAGEGVELQVTEQCYKNTHVRGACAEHPILYNAETWTLREKQKQRLRVFEITCLRKIEGITRRDRIRNEEIFNRLRLIDRIRNKQASTIFWTSESDEERTIPQNSIQRLYTWRQKERKAKETMDRHDQRGLQRTACDTS